MDKNSTLFLILICYSTLFNSLILQAQSPEISLREFASGQIKKGVRSIGMGGDGATWGNYSLVWKDSSTSLIDIGDSRYTNGNTFNFTAVGVTTPNLWHGLTIYIIALSQNALNISTSLKSAGLGVGSVPVHGDGNNQAVFLKSAMPLGKNFSFGILLSYERSQFSGNADSDVSNFVRYRTYWRPSGGFGISWQPNKNIFVGFRALFNRDWEEKIDNIGPLYGLNFAREFRLGMSIVIWEGAILDLGGNLRYTSNQIYNTSSSKIEPNIGFEQNLLQHHLAFRFGLDETSETGGLSVKFQPITIDIAYIHNLGMARFGKLFGTTSNSIIATLIFNYGNYISKTR